MFCRQVCVEPMRPWSRRSGLSCAGDLEVHHAGAVNGHEAVFDPGIRDMSIRDLGIRDVVVSTSSTAACYLGIREIRGRVVRASRRAFRITCYRTVTG